MTITSNMSTVTVENIANAKLVVSFHPYSAFYGGYWSQAWAEVDALQAKYSTMMGEYNGGNATNNYKVVSECEKRKMSWVLQRGLTRFSQSYITWSIDPGFSNPIRGRPKVLNNTLVADNGQTLRSVANAIHFDALSIGDLWTDGTLESWRSARDRWHMNIVRIFAYRQPIDIPGYTPTPWIYWNIPDAFNRIDAALNKASQLGMYLIICHANVCGYWHTDTMNWWRQVAARYKNNTNIIFEISNEPKCQTWAPPVIYPSTLISQLAELSRTISSIAPNTPQIVHSFATTLRGLVSIVEATNLF